MREALASGDLLEVVGEIMSTYKFGRIIGNPRELNQFVLPIITQHPGLEKFYCIFLNAKNRVLAYEALFTGTLSQSAVYPREVVKRALDLNAASVIFIHNHPSGEPEPSPEDIRITRRLMAAMKVCGVTVLEHLIASNGSGATYSFADNGYIEQISRDLEVADARIF